MVIKVSPSFQIVVLRAYVKQLIKAGDELLWQLHHDEICLSTYEKLQAERRTELTNAKEELNQLEIEYGKTKNPARPNEAVESAA